MPVKTVTISSLSGAEIPEGTGARVRVIFADPDRDDMKADLTDEEAARLVGEYRAEQVTPRPDRRARRVRV